MQKIQENELGRLRRVKKYFVDHTLTPAIPRVTELSAEVNVLEAGLAEHGGLQVEGFGKFRAGTAERRLLARDLRRSLQDIADVANGLDETEYPGVREIFRVAGQSRSYQRLLDMAEAFVDALPPYKAAFVERGFAADFDTVLEAAAEAFALATGRQEGGKQSRKEGTSGVAELTRRAKATMRELGPIMVSTLRKTAPILLPVWQAAARVYSAPSSTTAPTTPPPEPAPTEGSGS